jgi:hypothetical protein
MQQSRLLRRQCPGCVRLIHTFNRSPLRKGCQAASGRVFTRDRQAPGGGLLLRRRVDDGGKIAVRVRGCHPGGARLRHGDSRLSVVSTGAFPGVHSRRGARGGLGAAARARVRRRHSPDRPDGSFSRRAYGRHARVERRVPAKGERAPALDSGTDRTVRPLHARSQQRHATRYLH